MAKLTPEERAALPDDDFAIPEERKYPLIDRAHAIDALSRVKESGTPDEQRRVAIKVNERYPDIRTKLRGIADA